MIRTYSGLLQYSDLNSRFNYLRLTGSVGRETFGFDRAINQRFYKSHEWKTIRHHVIARDMACDLGIPGYELYDGLLIHHMNPLTLEDVENGSDAILDPEYLITTSHSTHNAIHYGTESRLPKIIVDRTPGDTKLW